MTVLLTPAIKQPTVTLYPMDGDSIVTLVPKTNGVKVVLTAASEQVVLNLASIMRGPVGPTPNVDMVVHALGAGDLPTITKTVDSGGNATFDLGIPSAAVGAGFGAIKYQASGLNLALPAGVQTQLVFSPTTVSDEIKAPFNGHDFWDGSLIRALALNDVFAVKVTIGITPLLVGGDLDLVITPFIGAVPKEDNRAFNVQAGQTQTITISFPIIAMAPFLANGGMILLKPSVPALVTSASLSFYPWSIA